MATTATRVTTITYSGDVNGTETTGGAANAASPAQSQIITLAVGANTITAPASGTTPTALTIIPPAGNATAVTLKGVSGDTGIPIHLTDSLTISLASGFTSLVLSVGTQIVGVRLLWS
jgi:hypothetical protein